MATEAYTDVVVTAADGWVDLVASHVGLASVASYIQNKTGGYLTVAYTAAGTAPTGTEGVNVRGGEIVQGNAAHIWVKAAKQTISVGCGLGPI